MTERPLLACGPAEASQALLEGLLVRLGLTGTLVSGKDPHGRPTLCLDGQPLAFSLSRAGDHSHESGARLLTKVARSPLCPPCGVQAKPGHHICALAMALKGRVGVDLVAPFRGDPGPLEALFHLSEREWIRELRGEARGLALTRCWAAKEALLKALGLGLGFGPDAVELAPGRDGSLRVARIAGQEAEGWHLELSSVEDLILALAWAE